MFALHFFSENNDNMSIEDVFNAVQNRTKDVDIVREGEFDTLEDAIYRMNNIGSRWFFYPNACIKQNDLIVGLYFACGLVMVR